MNRAGWQCRYFSLVDCGLTSQSSVERAATQWLSAEEQSECLRFRSPLRRQSWVAGRVAAKQMLRLHPLLEGVSLRDITIRSREHDGSGTSPCVFISGQQQSIPLSISHVERGVLVGLAAAGHFRIGVDLVSHERFGRGFCRLWFTDQEQVLMRRSCGRFSPAALWAAKESAYKALSTDDSFSPRQIEIQLLPDGRLTCRLKDHDMQAECSIHDWHVDGMSACLAVQRVAIGRDSQDRLTTEGRQHD